MDRQSAERYLRQRISPDESLAALTRFPRYFEIETVNGCNARCPMCTIADWQRKSPVMRDHLFEKIASEICEHRDDVIRVSLYRDGEPLLDNKLARRIARLKDGGIHRVGISTNVSLLHEPMARDILEAGIDEVILSIDSLKKDVFEAIRVRLDFEEVMENARRFIELRNRLRPETQIRVRMIRQASNIDEWPAYDAYWRPKIAAHDRVYYLNIHNWGDQLKNHCTFGINTQKEKPCVALWSLMVIFANGDVPLCNVDYNNKFPTGNISTQSIAEIWQSSIANERRDFHMEGRRDGISLCENCSVWDEPSDVHTPELTPVLAT